MQVHVLDYLFIFSPLPDNILNRLREDRATLRKVRLRDVERRDEPDHLVHACRQDQQALLHTLLRNAARELRRCARVPERVVRASTHGRRELDGDHEALAAHVEDHRRNLGARTQRVQCREELLRAGGRAVSRDVLGGLFKERRTAR